MATWTQLLRHGKDTILNDIKDFTFESVIFPDGTKLKDVTFEQLSEQVWTNVNKSSAPVWTHQTKN